MPLKTLSYYEKQDIANEIFKILREKVPLTDLYEVSELSVLIRKRYENPNIDIDNENNNIE
tara:strand:- start:70 stop:252 length:183 start_codon:yes stop_codon:yes gene_type:complete